MKGKLMIMLLLIGSILFGAPAVPDRKDFKSFNIRLTIAPVHVVKILEEVPANVGAFNSAPTITKHVFTEPADSTDPAESAPAVKYYMVVKTNNKRAVNINVVAQNMKSTDTTINTQIAYKIYAGGITVTSTKNEVTRTLFREATPLVKNGMRIVSQPFIIALDSSSINNAIPATYTSNITFNLITP